MTPRTCTHPHATVTYTDARCPLCLVIERTREAMKTAGMHHIPEGRPDLDLCARLDDVARILEGVE